jgi:hypothetical protein
MAEIAARISEVAGKTVRYVNVTDELRRQALLSAGVAPYFADALDEQARSVGAARNRESTWTPTRHSESDPRPSQSLRATTPQSSEATRPVLRGDAESQTTIQVAL